MNYTIIFGTEMFVICNINFHTYDFDYFVVVYKTSFVPAFMLRMTNISGPSIVLNFFAKIKCQLRKIV